MHSICLAHQFYSAGILLRTIFLLPFFGFAQVSLSQVPNLMIFILRFMNQVNGEENFVNLISSTLGGSYPLLFLELTWTAIRQIFVL